MGQEGSLLDRIRELEIGVPAALEAELISLEQARKAKPVSGIEAPDQEERKLIEELAAIPAEIWFELSHWAKETGNLQGWQRGIAFGIGRRASQGREPSRKQAIQGIRIIEEAERLGFKRSEAPVTRKSA